MTRILYKYRFVVFVVLLVVTVTIITLMLIRIVVSQLSTSAVTSPLPTPTTESPLPTPTAAPTDLPTQTGMPSPTSSPAPMETNTPTPGGEWWEHCTPCPAYPIQPTYTPNPTPTCQPCPASPTPYPTPTPYPPQPTSALPQSTPSPQPTHSPTPTPGGPSGRTLKWYGVDTVEPDDFGLLAQYHINTVFVVLDVNDSQTEWSAYLNEAANHDLMVMVWPLGGSGACGLPYNGTDISEAHRLLDYLATKDHFVAILNAHEPFWSCPMTVEEMTTIKTKIKTYVMQSHGREISVINHIDNLDDYYFQHAAPEDIGGIMDIAGVWKHCFNGEGSCQYMLEQTIADRQAIVDAGFEQDVKLVLFFQTFAAGGYRMPSAQEMQEWACAALQTDALDGFFWYTWDNPSSYSQYLSKDRWDSDNQDRWEAMRYVWENCVSHLPLPAQAGVGRQGR